MSPDPPWYINTNWILIQQPLSSWHSKTFKYNDEKTSHLYLTYLSFWQSLHKNQKPTVNLGFKNAYRKVKVYNRYPWTKFGHGDTGENFRMSPTFLSLTTVTNMAHLADFTYSDLQIQNIPSILAIDNQQ